MDELNGYIILAGVLLMLALIAYVGYNDLLSRVHKRNNTRRQRRSVTGRRRESGSRSV